MTTTSEQRLSVAKTILQQILAGIASQFVFFSWGVSKKFATEYNNMPALALRVSGLYHKGWVYVALNEGADLYTVTLTSVRGTVKKVFEDIYCDGLGELLDRVIERGDTDEKTYSKRAAKDTSQKLKHTTL